MEKLFEERAKWLEELKHERCQAGDASFHLRARESAIERANLFYADLASIFEAVQKSAGERMISTREEWTAWLQRYVGLPPSNVPVVPRLTARFAG